MNGKLVPQLGGGICQVGTTLFNAVFVSGLPVVERHNHSFYISHYPKGRDATVSWGGPDLKFKNDTDDWVLISVSYTSSSITISLYGTDPGYEVDLEDERVLQRAPVPDREDRRTRRSPRASRSIEDARRRRARRAPSTRTVKKDGKVVRTDTFTSVYRPKVEVVRVGTKPTASKDTTDKAGTPKN